MTRIQRTGGLTGRRTLETVMLHTPNKSGTLGGNIATMTVECAAQLDFTADEACPMFLPTSPLMYVAPTSTTPLCDAGNSQMMRPSYAPPGLEEVHLKTPLPPTRDRGVFVLPKSVPARSDAC
jgi:hypothetical protein